MSIMGDQYFSEGQNSHVSASEMAARRAFQHGVASRIFMAIGYFVVHY